MGYVDEVLAKVKEKNASEPEFLQAVEEVLESLRPVIEANEELYKKNAILERITEPDRQVMFRTSFSVCLTLSPLEITSLSASFRVVSSSILIKALA